MTLPLAAVYFCAAVAHTGPYLPPPIHTHSHIISTLHAAAVHNLYSVPGAISLATVVIDPLLMCVNRIRAVCVFRGGRGGAVQAALRRCYNLTRITSLASMLTNFLWMPVGCSCHLLCCVTAVFFDSAVWVESLAPAFVLDGDSDMWSITYGYSIGSSKTALAPLYHTADWEADDSSC